MGHLVAKALLTRTTGNTGDAVDGLFGEFQKTLVGGFTIIGYEYMRAYLGARHDRARIGGSANRGSGTKLNGGRSSAGDRHQSNESKRMSTHGRWLIEIQLK
jgi:hypothetical protein